MNDAECYEIWRDTFDRASFVGCGIDWNRVTIDAERLPWGRDGVGIVRGVRVLAGDSARGNRPKSFSNSGYSGIALGNATLGYRGDSAWVELRSDGADRLWRSDWYDLAHCTRLDARIDLLVKSPVQYLGDCIMRGYEWYTANTKKNGRWKVPSYTRKGRGETVYIGSRESDYFIRLYNKSVESGWNHPDGDIWRIEIQWNNPIANEVSHGIRRMGYTDRKLHGVVTQWCERAGVLSGNRYGYKSLVQFEAPRIDTDSERSLSWLSRSVRGTVKRLTADGQYDKVEKALGLYGLDTRND